jgi:hypothetical protein
MSKYYTMEQEVDREESFVLTSLPDIEPKRPWYLGERFGIDPPDPLELIMDPTSGPIMPDFFDAGIPVFSAKLCQAMHEAGVDTFDRYPAVMIDPNTGHRWADYFAVNVIGKVSCADMKQSTYLDPTDTGQISVFFSQLVIDPMRARGHLMFRLAESLGELIIHDSVVKVLRTKDLKCLRFDPVSV